VRAALDYFVHNRLARAFGGSVLFTIGLFTLLNVMISADFGDIDKNKPLQAVDFIRLKKDSDLETRERRKPPPPQKPKEPPPPKMKVETKAEPQRTTPDIPFKMNLSMTGMSGGPFIGNFSAGEISGDSDLIPLVAIQPQYPRNAARDGIEGWVDVEITIGPDGSVKSARAVGAKPRGVFESAAVQAAYKSRFRPKIVDGKGVEARGIRRYNFSLGEQ
jgi:periplasmic protein TonB